ncbi:histidine kinase dimerization/phospho-acceptor domain-containing protein, partial [Klebsiella pneumoniae]|uniref:histidine kinase dimerization/phospho-acceptor domain-containing protein n=1 Tax=Klebsiella pneumoniae TaxID=573 RepID=UPI0027320640
WMESVEANRIRTMILGNVAHDMRSPIALSVSALTALRDGSFGQLNQRQHQWVERSLQSLHHAITLTGDIFDLMKAEMGELVI